jgi:hypothetical protein
MKKSVKKNYRTPFSPDIFFLNNILSNNKMHYLEIILTWQLPLCVKLPLLICGNAHISNNKFVYSFEKTASKLLQQNGN